MTRFAWLLVALVILFLAAGVSGLNREANRWFEFIEPVAYAVVMMAAVRAVASSRWGLGVGLGLCVPALVSGVWAAVAPGQTIALILDVSTAGFLLFVAGRVVGHLFHCQRVDADALCAAAGAYVVAGVAWAALYSLVYDLDPDAFRLEGPSGERTLSLSSRHSIHVLYFSFVTLTTLGYGDVVPISAPARVLAMLEAAAGQLYLTVLVARLVGLHLRPEAAKTNSDLLEAEDAPSDEPGGSHSDSEHACNGDEA